MRYALDALRRRPGRSAMTSLGIGLAVGLVVLLLALSAGIETSATTLATQSGVDLIAVSANVSSPLAGQFPPIQGAHSLTERIPSIDPNVETASPWLVSDLVFGNASLWTAANQSSVPGGWGPTESGTVGWIPSENTGIQTPDITNGSGFTAAGDPYYANGSYNGSPTHEIVLDQGLAGVLHVSVGDRVWVGAAQPPSAGSLPGWYANATGFRVVGVSGPFWLVPSALLAFAYLSEVQKIVGGASASTDYASLVLVHLTDPTTVNSDQTRLAAAFPQMTVFTLASILGAIQHVVNLYRTFGELIGLIGVVVAALFATTVLQMSVDDRSRELALLRAIGHSRPSVGVLVVEEGLLLSAFGLVAGLPVAYVAGYGLNLYLRNLLAGLPASFSFVSFDPGVLLAGVLLVLAVGLVAAIAPAARAMQLPVAEELRAP
ncbi:MAG TPA: FtsX-like permease family protein [Thermoplasmata archaeon]|nr:FtsX-like permease family protein [Thermoplasmata archaeon]